MSEMGLAAAMSGVNMYGNGDGQSVKHYYDKKSMKGSNMACKKKPGKK